MRTTFRAVTVTITSGQSLSAEAQIGNSMIVGVLMPSTWTAANLTFQFATGSGGTFFNVYDEYGFERTVSVAVTTGQYTQIEPNRLPCFNYVKVRSGTAGVPVNQGADRSIVLYVRDFE